MKTAITDLCGRVLASTGAVTLEQSKLSRVCTGFEAGNGDLNGGLDVVTIPGGVTQAAFLPSSHVNKGGTVPEPATQPLMGLGLLGLGYSLRQRTVEITSPVR